MTRTALRPLPARAAFLAGAALLALALPAAADYTRYCTGALRISPQNPSMTWLHYDFSVGKTVRLYAQVNEARRDARARMLACVRAHWSAPEAEARPDDCLGIRDYHVRDYPFERLGEVVSAALCAANPGAESLLVSVDLTVSGDVGCAGSGGADTVNILRNFPIRCAAPVGEGGDDEAGPEPPIGDAGGWECVGAGCDGTGAPGAEDDGGGDDAPAPPATASYTPLPGFRLPGNDLYLIELGAPNWMLCRQACTDDARCGAWTYRNPTAASGPLCLVKSRAGVPIPDLCCRSGIKQ